MTDGSEKSAELQSAASGHRDFVVVGIGSSSGALDALRGLFNHMPPAPDFACVIVVHLSPDHDSHLAELLQPYTQMPVQQVAETVALEPGHVYVIPPNANLNSIDTHLRLSGLESRRLERAPIDYFFRTLAATHDGNSVGLILTGAGSDGALGLRQIKEHGGLTIAQDPAEAEYDSMPRNAIATGTVDLILPLRDIPKEIERFCGTQPLLPVPGGDDAIGSEDMTLLNQIIDELRRRTGYEFSVYRRASVLRRLRRRMRLRHVDTLGRYLETLRNRPDEVRALRNELLLSVSEFFSDQEAFALLEQRVVPQLFERKRGPEERLRLWIIGCSTGEEAYSLAMLLLERSSGSPRQPALQVFASDLSDEALRRARQGIYPPEVASTVSPERLERFFVQEMGHYRIRREVRDLVVFVAHDLFSDPPFSHMDLIVCRNLFANLQPDMRRPVLRLLACALQPQGLLLAGPQDDIDVPELFVAESGRSGLFRRVSGPVSTRQISAPIGPFTPALQFPAETPGPRLSFSTPQIDPAAIYRMAMDRYILPSALIDHDDDVQHYSTHAARYLRIPGGELTHHVVRLVPEALRVPLQAGISAVRRNGRHWSSPPQSVATESGERSVRLHVDPVSPEALGSLLIVFDDCGLAEQLPPERNVPSPEQPPATFHEDARQAEQALSSVRAALDLAREELQAANEELISLVDENRHRLEELTQKSGDLQHLLEATGIATLFVDRSLRVMRFTPQLGELFHVRPADIGRPLADLTRELCYPELDSDARRVLDRLASVEREIGGHGDRWYMSRMLPYRTHAQRVEGVVITLIDITDRRRAEQVLREADRRKDEFLAMLAHELRNPLAPISSGIEILRIAGGDRRLVEQVSTTMARQVQQLTRLVEDLLEISRISGGKLRLQRAPVELSEVVADALAAVRALVAHAGHELVVSVPESPIVVDADAARLTQVLANLLNNAVRYTPGGGHISVGVRRDDGEAVVTVRDDGFGISRQAIGHVFEMFYQGDDVRLPRNAGLGIGLTLAKTLVEMHGGSISVESAGSDRGSEFQVRLPVSDTVLPPRLLTGIDVAPDTVSDQRILIVDDNADAAQTLSVLVQTLGNSEVQTASSGAQALRTAAKMRPDIVLLDLTMPEMDGFEVARRIRSETWGKDLLLVALTGWGQDEHRRRSKEAGFDRHITKPADMAALQSLLRERRRPLEKHV